MKMYVHMQKNVFTLPLTCKKHQAPTYILEVANIRICNIRL